DRCRRSDDRGDDGRERSQAEAEEKRPDERLAVQELGVPLQRQARGRKDEKPPGIGAGGGRNEIGAKKEPRGQWTQRENPGAREPVAPDHAESPRIARFISLK